MKILVTGGAGFMGSSFIRMLLQESLADLVVNYDKLTYAGNLKNLSPVDSNPKYKFVHADICDKSTLSSVVEDNKIDTIVHFAAETHVDRSIKSPDVFLQTNVLGTGNILDVATEFDIRLHHVSTDEVFGSLEIGDAPFNENTPYDPKSPYSASKASADHLVRAYHNTFNTKATISNCCNNFGPCQFPEKVIPLFITNLLNNKKIPMYGDGRNIRSWIYVDDHSRGVWEILNNGKLGETYMLGTNEELDNNTLAEIILAKMGKDKGFIEYVEDRKGHDKRYAVNTSKIEHELGWKAQISFEEGIEKTIEWYRRLFEIV